MPYRKRARSNSLRPINSTKNVYRTTNAITGNVVEDFAIAKTPNLFDPATVIQDVVENCRIYRIFVEFWIYGTLGSGVNNPFDWYVFKNPGNNLAFQNPNSYDSNDENKNYIFATGKGILGRLQEGSPPYVIRKWFKIPRSHQIMKKGDRIGIRFQSTGANFCLCVVYKWYK